MDQSTLSKPGPIIAHEDRWAFVMLNCVGPSLPLLSTWVAVDVQETFYSAFCTEQACQARLMTQTHVVNSDYPYQRNIGLEWFTLQAKIVTGICNAYTSPTLLDSQRGGTPPALRKTAVWTAVTPPLA
ncbi:uncharacterized protein F5147DRAFT_766466 [Suillus discolor]|uniref:Uncharacterized protein n=1 Tax=Suillus discolor TaxID=1912936 RepID=A0A9P7FK64_9AGAM|nr:uncharacterized protein F5147DRAFT_766466 [Suillus discolor]KAG2120551.1 hypothetical protein F5147DRAFT_766466 [Suillus discolor]